MLKTTSQLTLQLSIHHSPKVLSKSEHSIMYFAEVSYVLWIHSTSYMKENIFIYYQHYPRWIGEHSGLEHGGYTKEIYVNFNKGRVIHYGKELTCY